MYFTLSSPSLRNSRKNTQVLRFSTKYQTNSGISNNPCLTPKHKQTPVLMELWSACTEELGWVKIFYFFQNYLKKNSQTYCISPVPLCQHTREGSKAPAVTELNCRVKHWFHGGHLTSTGFGHTRPSGMPALCASQPANMLSRKKE